MKSRFDRSAAASMPVRLSILGVVVTSLFVALFARLFFLQVIDQPKLAAAAKENQLRTVYEDAPRGRILDRNGVVLVGNKETDVISVDREAAQKDPQLLVRLATFLNTDVQSLTKAMNSSATSPYKPVPVAQNVDKAVIASFKERSAEFQGAYAETHIERWYPNGTLAAHVLGYTGDANEKELTAHKNQGYRLGDQVGKSGVEAAYESQLRGKAGVDTVEVSSTGQTVRVVNHTEPVPGDDIVLSIDANVQRTAEDSLRQGLEVARTQTSDGGNLKASGGSVVAVSPQDGSILALASYPTYDPSSFTGGISQAEYAQLTDPNSGLPLNNRAIQGEYAPGSTFKLVTAVAALQSGLITADTTISDGGVFVLGNQRFRNAQGRAYGTINLPRALTVSSDVYFYNLGAKFWSARSKLGDPIQSTAHDFGFGSKAGVGLAGEASGRVPDPASRKKLHEQYPNAYPEGNWYAGDNVNLSIGQGDTLVTPLQLANSYATFANGGTLYRPMLVLRVVDPSGKVIDAKQPQVIHKADIAAGVRSPVEAGLAGAVNDPRGTAYAAFNGFDDSQFEVAGKTGTAQVNGKGDTALFAGYGPVGNSKVAVSVVLEEAGFGGTAAAPVARSVFAAVAGQSSEPIKLGTGQD